METKRIDLPSGGWWEFRLPTYERDRREYLAILDAGPEDDPTLSERVLLAFTISTSLGIALTYEGMGEMTIDDLEEVWHAFNSDVRPRFLGARARQRLADGSTKPSETA